ncbi:LD-carboxypeptidase [Viridibacillus sp. YIM B01967]|uniref:LD-carboxypeptidase n=1 Tax=Viridibacillus soli TaxID=2798301 RepID=A0ABS1HC03_9BACL|nr:LD-carboxypeptidase [Viridibacillus soli]MBK3496974.1 LD-carboxypeptidase [Viridibacillus soli]
MKNRPMRLQRGDTIGIIAPSSPPNLENLQNSLAFLEGLGLQYKFGSSITHVNGYLAGTDEERLNDLHTMFADPSIAGIICAGGGYGAARYTDKIDFQLLAENPKIFWGYSDITFLHTAIGRYSNFITFHGPMLASDVGRATFHEKSAQMFKQLFQPMELLYTEGFSPLQTMVAGVATGEITGGNLSLLSNGLGTQFDVDTKGKLLLIEDVDEEPYKIDCMLNQLRQAGKLYDAAGFIIGDFSNAEPKKRKVSLTLNDVLNHYLGALNVPVVRGFKIGHCEPHFAIPLGAEAILNANDKTLTILPGVE